LFSWWKFMPKKLAEKLRGMNFQASLEILGE
jgi:hypothetical protein